MAHFAEIDENNIVLRVIPADDAYELTGEQLYESMSGKRWKKTSYNTHEGQHKLGKTSFRMNYAGIGDYFDENLDGFIKQSPYPSWVLNPLKGIYEPPIPIPSEDKSYEWNENTQTWIEV